MAMLKIMIKTKNSIRTAWARMKKIMNNNDLNHNMDNIVDDALFNINGEADFIEK